MAAGGELLLAAEVTSWVPPPEIIGARRADQALTMAVQRSVGCWQLPECLLASIQFRDVLVLCWTQRYPPASPVQDNRKQGKERETGEDI